MVYVSAAQSHLVQEKEECKTLPPGANKADYENRFHLLTQESSSENEEEPKKAKLADAENVPESPVKEVAPKQKKNKKRKKKADQVPHRIDDSLDSFVGKIQEGTNEVEKLTPLQIEIVKLLLIVDTKLLNKQSVLDFNAGGDKVETKVEGDGQEGTAETFFLVASKDAWPAVTSELSMTPVEPPEELANTNKTASAIVKEIQWFAFMHTKSYQKVQQIYCKALIDGADKDLFEMMLKRYPFHVHTLLGLSEMYKMEEYRDLAADLNDRSVMVLELAFHPDFKLASGNCRLDYQREENRPLFLALFKKAQYAEAAGEFRTALELAKIVLTLNPDVDPLAIVLVIDYYALRSGQFSWLVSFYEQYKAVRNLSELPNMAYSYSLALFVTMGECEKADVAVQYALLMFPGVLMPLLEALSIQASKRLESSEYFDCHADSLALRLQVDMYICRAKVVWRQHNIRKWLKRNINKALDRIGDEEEVIDVLRKKRLVRYLHITPPRSVLRHAVISDLEDRGPLSYFIFYEDSVIMSDPLAPVGSFNSYKRKFTKNKMRNLYGEELNALSDARSTRSNAAKRAMALELGEVNEDQQAPCSAGGNSFLGLAKTLFHVITFGIFKHVASPTTGGTQISNDILIEN